MVDNQPRCVSQISTNDGGWRRYHRCSRKAVVGEYCRQHDPVSRKARDDENTRLWNERWKVKEAAWAQQCRDQEDLPKLRRVANAVNEFISFYSNVVAPKQSLWDELRASRDDLFGSEVPAEAGVFQITEIV